MEQLLTLWSAWLAGESTDGLRLWGHPVLFWGRLGKLAQYVAGLTVLLDLFGKAGIERLQVRLGNAWARTLSNTTAAVPRSTSAMTSWFKKLLPLTFPLTYVTVGIIFYLANVHFMQYSRAVALWLTLVVVVVPPALTLIIILVAKSEDGPGCSIVGIPLFVLGMATMAGSWIEGREFNYLELVLIGVGRYAVLLVGAVVALIAYSVCALVVFQLALVGKLLFLAGSIALIAPAHWGLQKNAHPVRCLALGIFTIGFLLDLLAT